MTAANPTALTDELFMLLGPQGCLFGGDIATSGAVWDRSGPEGPARPLALLRPASVQEVSAALTLCHRFGVAVVPQGGLTGLAGGANPVEGAVLLSLSRFAGIEEIDPLSSTMTLRAGTVLEVAQKAAEAAGFLLPIDLGARGSCQIGGVVATNAGGQRVIGQGTTRENLLGIEAVLADGTVISHLLKVVKDNTGYNLGQLICGSEGTLAVITRVVVKLKPLPRDVGTVLCALPDFAAVIRLLDLARQRLTLSAFEVMWHDHFVMNGGKALFDATPAFAALVEVAGDPDGQALEALLVEAFEDGIVLDALIAKSLAEARRFWDVREGERASVQIRHEMNLDVSLAVGDMQGFAEDLLAGLPEIDPDVRAYVFGHVGDGNLHVILDLPKPDEDLVTAVDRLAYGIVQARAGSISAEHGIGTLKRDWLGYSRSPAELAAMRAIKAALDPKGILNPGKLL